MSYAEAIDLVMVLRETPGTHVHADINRWLYPATWMDIAALAADAMTVNVNRDRKKVPEPVEFVMPWTGVEDEVEQVTDEERAALKATLKQYSAFRD